ncbi:phosphosulfolactate synthase [Evansella clarkii]|uniref:phosphosulfolactate synthase n=1 Tax=Evansella clarkii TaxID=79879 RepID=UPI000B43CF47|nr:phosphosulfolactate synthase [Evansella clarkii]
MNYSKLVMPDRENKPRSKGLTILIDNGLPLQSFKDSVSSCGEFIDFVKFGWGTSIVTTTLGEKISCLKEHNIDYFFGGTLFEKFLSQGRLDDYHQYCREFGCRYVEISNGTIKLSNKDKGKYIGEFSKDFIVFSEVGSKDSTHSQTEKPEVWLEYIKEDFEAGAEMVITEARESGTSGLCSGDGEVRMDLIDEILAAEVDAAKIIFEAPSKKLQTLFIKKIGSDANLANIPFSDVIGLETLRLGLRSDTFYSV